MSKEFERASKNKYRFRTTRGELSTEQLWSLALTSKRSDDVTLDSIAMSIAEEIDNKVKVKSFVTQSNSKVDTVLEDQLVILQYIIKDKLDAIKKAQESNEVARRREVLLAALETKKIAGINEMSEDDLMEELGKL